MNTTAIILAGGQGSRLENRDKGLLNWHGKRLIEYVIEEVRAQVDEIILSCNRNLAAYRKLGYPVIPDRPSGFRGPLTGLASTLPFVTNPHILLLACDCPLLPSDLVSRLESQLLVNNADIAFVDDGTRQHYLCALMNASVNDSLREYLDHGPDSSVKGWYRTLHSIPVDFSDLADHFLNINTIKDLNSNR